MAEMNATMPKPAAAATPAQANQQPNPTNADPSKSAGAIQAVGAPVQIQTSHQRQRWLKMLIYAKHGIGKTELAATSADVPEMRDVLTIDAEKGDTTIENSPRVKNPHLIHNIPVSTFKTVAYIQEFLSAYCKARDAGDIAKMKSLFCRVTGLDPKNVPDDQVPRYKTVIIDSLTEIEVYCTYGILSIDAQKVMMEGDMDVAGWPEFRKNNEMVKLLVRAFRDLPMNVIFVCAEQYSQDEQKKFHYTPQLTGKLSGQVQGFVDIVGWLTVGQLQEGQIEAPRRLYVQPVSGGPKFDAKNRRPVWRQAYFDNPSMMDIMKGTGLLRE
jgi:hypothetical protein